MAGQGVGEWLASLRPRAGERRRSWLAAWCVWAAGPSWPLSVGRLVCLAAGPSWPGIGVDLRTVRRGVSCWICVRGRTLFAKMFVLMLFSCSGDEFPWPTPMLSLCV